METGNNHPTGFGPRGQRCAWWLFALFVLLCALTFADVPASTYLLAHKHFSADVIQRGAQYAFERRLLFWGGTLIHVALLLALVFRGWGRRWANICGQIAHGYWLPTLLLMGGFYFLLLSLIHLPFDLYRFALQRDWRLTDRTLEPLLSEYGLALAVNVGIEAIVFVSFYLLLRWLPRWWWLAAALGATVLAIIFAMLLPIVISPLFNTFTPIGQTRWADWEKPLHRLVEKAGAPVEEILVMNASKQSRHTNAYFTGFGTTRRIVLYDNLLEKNTLPEVESVLAHELGHWLYNHIVQGIALGGVAALVGFYLLAKLLRWAQGPLGLHSPSDPRGLPLILLAGFLGSWFVSPASNAVSRHFERQADMMALELAGQPDVFISVEKKLAIDNIGHVAPAPWNVWLFATHPPAVERIQMAEEWKQTHR